MFPFPLFKKSSLFFSCSLLSLIISSSFSNLVLLILRLLRHPGPSFRAVLTEVEDAQLEGLIQTSAEALAFALAKLRNLPQEKHG